MNLKIMLQYNTMPICLAKNNFIYSVFILQNISGRSCKFYLFWTGFLFFSFSIYFIASYAPCLGNANK